MNWIKTSERLPEELINVLIFGLDEGKTFFDVAELSTFDEETLWYPHSWINQHTTVNYSLDMVTHWAPLTQPPKEEQRVYRRINGKYEELELPKD